MQDATLVIPLKGDPISEVLLGYKKVGFGQGKLTGIGGKVESNEPVIDAAVRELAEEAIERYTFYLIISQPQTDLSFDKPVDIVIWNEDPVYPHISFPRYQGYPENENKVLSIVGFNPQEPHRLNVTTTFTIQPGQGTLWRTNSEGKLVEVPFDKPIVAERWKPA